MEDGVLVGFEDLVHVVVECLKNFGIFCCGFGGIFKCEKERIIWRIGFGNDELDQSDQPGFSFWLRRRGILRNGF